MKGRRAVTSSWPVPVVYAACVTSMSGALPMALLGAVAVQVTTDVSVGALGLGSVMAAFFLVSAVVSVPGGRLVERIGWHRAMRMTALTNTAAVIAVATLAQTWAHLLICFAVCGVGNALAQPAANLAIAEHVRHRPGLAFGVKQAALPVGTMLSGLAVPGIALTLGWRWAFAAAGLAIVCLSLPIPRRSPATATARTRRVRPVDERGAPDVPPSLTMFSLGAAFGAAGASALGGFTVLTAVSFGLDPRVAGLVLVGGGISGIIVRVVSGWIADYHPGALMPAVSAMLATGALAFGCVAATGTLPVLFAAAVLVSFGMGYGWNAVFNLAVVREHAHAPAAATGVTQAGVWAGGVAGPLIFGGVADTHSYSGAWLVAGSLLLASALVILAGVRLRRQA